MTRDRGLLALAVAGTVIGVAGTVVAEVGIAADPSSTLNDVMYALTAVTACATGLFLLVRRRRLGIGWLILGIGAANGVEAAANAWAEVTYGRVGDLPIAQLTGWEAAGPALARLADVAWLPGVFGTIILFVIFPDGRPPTPGFRWLLRADVAASALVFAVLALAPNGADFPRWERPLVVFPTTVAQTALAVIQLGMVLGSVVAVVVRFRRADTVTRQQLKWIVWLGFLLSLTTLVGLPVDVFSGFSPVYAALTGIASNLVISLFPVAIGVAVSRYRLFDIDRLLSRTVSYALLSGIIAALFAGVVLLVPELGLGSNWGVAAATLLALAVLAPLRRRLQDLVDRRFDRARVDGRRTAEAFALRLRDEVDLETVRTDLLGTVTRSLSPAGASLWLVR